MKKLITNLTISAAVAGGALALLAGRGPVSPHETITQEVDGANLKIVYGRPYSKDPRTGEIRQIWGKLVPWGKVWRTGADAATLLTADKPIVLGGQDLAAGTYSLFTVPEETGTSKLVINKKTGQWGIPYNEANEKTNEIARVDMKKSDLDKQVDQFTMAIEKNPAGGGQITMMWEKLQFSVPFTVKK